MRRPTPVAVYAGAFVFLLGSGAAAALSHFTASRIAPWLSLGLSAAAVVAAMMALAMSSRR